MTNDKMVSSQVIGIDVGGTAIKLGRFTADGTCLQSLTMAAPQPTTPEAVLAVLVDAIAQIDPNNETFAIGVGTPGPSDAAGRIAKIAINLPGWIDVPLADWLEAKTGKPTAIANDANCALLGEAWLGAGRQFQNLILLTLGTGVGGAIILDGKLFIGHQGAAGELGLISLNPNGPICNSGNQGSLEQHASATAIRRRTLKEPIELGVLAQQGEAAALTFWQDYGKDLGIGLTSLIYVLTPQAIVIGGGISGSFEFFLPAVKAEIEKRVQALSRDGLQILPAELGNFAGIVGAARLALQHYSRF
ncbi:ROK family protein [Nostoc sp. TCL240-02]|uniref:ROK family protein n=1 Tax=Nostoc sp. TCL240-02 TaxID=2572090 RepID=UPI0020C6DC37|nr:ROK family protein [Nostoc sp. TCL240-02]